MISTFVMPPLLFWPPAINIPEFVSEKTKCLYVPELQKLINFLC